MSKDFTLMPLCLVLVYLLEGEFRARCNSLHFSFSFFTVKCILPLFLFSVLLPFCQIPLVLVFFASRFTLCSMLLLNYLARKRTESGLVAGITISVPWDTMKSAASMEEPLNWLLFNKFLTRGLCSAVTRSDKLQLNLFLIIV